MQARECYRGAKGELVQEVAASGQKHKTKTKTKTKTKRVTSAAGGFLGLEAGLGAGASASAESLSSAFSSAQAFAPCNVTPPDPSCCLRQPHFLPLRLRSAQQCATVRAQRQTHTPASDMRTSPKTHANAPHTLLQPAGLSHQAAQTRRKSEASRGAKHCCPCWWSSAVA